MKILVAEDVMLQARYLQKLLESLGHEVRMAANGAEALRILELERIPLVISDWVMPVLDGPTLCRRIRESNSGSYTYVILLTALDRRGDRMEGLRAGADDFLVKPVYGEELAARIEIARRILDVQARLERQNALLLDQAATDELTGLKNRREFLRALEFGFSLSSREGLPLSLVLLDVDHFKSFNDTFGHPAGDGVLREIGFVLKNHCRDHDTAARQGGEEFAMILFGAGRDEAGEVAERLRADIADRPWSFRNVTASFGVATHAPGLRDVATLIAQADRALYRSKHRGRNCVTHHDALGDPLAGQRGLVAAAQ